MYRVEKYWFTSGTSGFGVYKFAFRRLDNQPPPPWTFEEGTDNNISKNDGNNNSKNDNKNCKNDDNIFQNDGNNNTKNVDSKNSESDDNREIKCVHDKIDVKKTLDDCDVRNTKTETNIEEMVKCSEVGKGDEVLTAKQKNPSEESETKYTESNESETKSETDCKFAKNTEIKKDKSDDTYANIIEKKVITDSTKNESVADMKEDQKKIDNKGDVNIKDHDMIDEDVACIEKDSNRNEDAKDITEDQVMMDSDSEHVAEEKDHSDNILQDMTSSQDSGFSSQGAHILLENDQRKENSYINITEQAAIKSTTALETAKPLHLSHHINKELNVQTSTKANENEKTPRKQKEKNSKTKALQASGGKGKQLTLLEMFSPKPK